jgi:hypothetical protein
MEISQIDHHGRTFCHDTVIRQDESGHLCTRVNLPVALRDKAIRTTEDVNDFEGNTTFCQNRFHRG